MQDLIRAGTPTLPESGDIFTPNKHWIIRWGVRKYSANEDGDFSRLGVPGSYNTRTCKNLITSHTTLKRKTLKVEPFRYTQILGIYNEPLTIIKSAAHGK